MHKELTFLFVYLIKTPAICRLIGHFDDKSNLSNFSILLNNDPAAADDDAATLDSKN